MRCTHTRVHGGPIHHAASHAVKIRIRSNVFLHRCFVSEWLPEEAGAVTDMRGSRITGGEAKCGFDLKFRLKIHQDLLNRCICQAGGDTQNGLHNPILFGCSGAQVCVCICVWTCTAAQTPDLYSLLDLPGHLKIADLGLFLLEKPAFVCEREKAHITLMVKGVPFSCRGRSYTQLSITYLANAEGDLPKEITSSKNLYQPDIYVYRYGLNE